jgi:hypothetical protein
MIRARRWFCLISFVSAAIIGCNPRPAAVVTKASFKEIDPAADLADSVREQMRKSTEATTSRRLVEMLNNYLPRLSADRRPATLSAVERSMLESEFALQPREVAEVARAEFTAVDGYYFDEVLLFRDVARSLDVEGRPPAEQAAAALAWVDRNIRDVPANGPALPVALVAMRGAGTPLERTYILLALCRQLGLDAALIGDAGAGTEGVWAVGVLNENRDQIHLFDARLGLPLPGPDGNGVLTLAAARTAADPFKALAIDPKLKYDVTAERAKRAEVFATAPFSAMSPRMRFFQELIGPDEARVSVDPATLRERFRKAAGNSNAANVRLWCPRSADAVPRLLFTFLPASEGGGDTSQPERRFLFRDSLVPFQILPQFLGELQGEPGQRIRNQLLAIATMLDAPGRPHDLILRGQFQEATDQLADLQTRFDRRPSDSAELAKNAAAWADAARACAADQIRLKEGRGDAETAARMDANRAIADSLWQSPQGPVAFILFKSSDLIAAHTAYLLGQCKHEEAERQAARSDSAASNRPNWSTVQMWWTRFVTNYPNSPWAPAAKRNLARALEAGGQREAARKAYLHLSDSAPNSMERLACRYWAEKLK